MSIMAQATQMVLQQLEYTLESDNVPPEERRHAARLLSRLQSPVQVVVLGRPGAGKSRLMNMLIGEAVIPEEVDLPTLEIAAGAKPQTVYQMVDGSEQYLDGLHLDQPTPADVAIVRVELTVPILDRMTLTELTLSGSPAEQRAIVDWAKQRADIVLWCSQTFDPGEQALWATAPEALKDHSFLVLTKADQLLMKGVLPDRIAWLDSVVSEAFYSLFPVATIQAISARAADGSRNEDLWNSSGGRALSDAILRLVETGRRADTDNALMFLNRYAPTPPQTPKMTVKTQQQTPPAQNLPPNSPQATDTSTVTGTGKSDSAKALTDTSQVFHRALDLLQKRADLMLNAVTETNGDSQGAVLDHCLETANALSQLLMDAGQMDPALSEIQDDVMECTDMMVLFHLEKTEDAAADAVTMLLQLKKEMSEAATT